MVQHLSRVTAAVTLMLLFLVPATALAQQNTQIRPATTGVKTYTTNLTGAAEVPGPGDSDGSGRTLVVLNPNKGTVCYTFVRIMNIAAPTAAHIHEGAAGTSGPPVVDLRLPQNGRSACVSGVDPAVLDRIRANPAGFYVNVHNADHPAGAIRGQLTD